MNDKKGWGATVLGWFVVPDDDEGQRGEGGDASGDAGGEGAAEMPQVFVKEPPAAIGGQVDFDAVFEAAGIDEEQSGAGREGAGAAGQPAGRDAGRRQEADRRGVAQGVRRAHRQDHRGGRRPRSRRSRATSAPAPPTPRQLLAGVGRSASSSSRTRSGSIRTRHGPARAGAAGGGEGLQRQEAERPAGPRVLRAGGGGARRAGRLAAGCRRSARPDAASTTEGRGDEPWLEVGFFSAARQPVAGVPVDLDLGRREGAPGDRLRERHQLDGREVHEAEDRHRGHHPAARGHRRALPEGRRASWPRPRRELSGRRRHEPGRPRGRPDPEEERS